MAKTQGILQKFSWILIRQKLAVIYNSYFELGIFKILHEIMRDNIFEVKGAWFLNIKGVFSKSMKWKEVPNMNFLDAIDFKV